jgi:hypothetical protein
MVYTMAVIYLLITTVDKLIVYGSVLFYRCDVSSNEARLNMSLHNSREWLTYVIVKLCLNNYIVVLVVYENISW